MKFDPKIHHRHTIRLQGYDYSQAGAYFVTIVSYGRECLFGEIVGAGLRPAHTAEMKLNEFQQFPFWKYMPEQRLSGTLFVNLL